MESQEWKVDIIEIRRVQEQALTLCDCLLQMDGKRSVFDLANAWDKAGRADLST
ncbi:hypothetical protein Q4E93_15525 [Flavitalea sp. BT771]|uniref:hypothetical protein n=1 Tax=Flavitalea sp. BT771 TaxID=3063329 RepID=UPI0026E12EA3|nr:hypothetical protein [Flavitalea sp. BT771]MDO6432011.1 hypothetical protein [Flavitalea sp. BT771]MDV6220920.1 hypothetical protein [Flavitalea sp. BT771]